MGSLNPDDHKCPKCGDLNWCIREAPIDEAAVRARALAREQEIAKFVAAYGHELATVLNVESYDIADRDAQLTKALKRAAHRPARPDPETALISCRSCDHAEEVSLSRAVDAAVHTSVRRAAGWI